MTHHKFKKTASIVFAVCVCTPLAIAQSLGGSTPPSETLVWKNERDLLILIQEAEDRIALANAVLEKCIENTPPMPESVRIDGLRITGAVFYRDNDLAQAENAFTTVVNTTSDPTWLAEAHRMLGQVYYGKGDFSNSMTHLHASVDNALIEDPSGAFISTQSSIEQAASVACILGNFQDGLDFATIGLTLYPTPSAPVDPSGPFLYWAYVSAKGLQDISLAAQHLDELLDRHPSYGEDDLAAGIRPMLIIDQFELRGEGWTNPSQGFFDALTGIVTSDKHVLMPVRTAICEKFASLLTDHGQSSLAAEIADFALRSTADAVIVNASLDAFLAASLGRASGQLALQNAGRKQAMGDQIGAVETLTLLLDSELIFSTELQAEIEAAYFDVSGQQYQPLP